MNAAVRKAVKACLQQAPQRPSRTQNTPSTQPVNDLPPAKAITQQTLIYEVDVTFVTDAEIATLNGNYRHKNRPTDVLSFAQSEGEAFALDPTLAGFILLGDIIISVETAQRQALELRHDIETEIAFLGVHGTLHLLGYDHIKASERRVMWQWQEAIFEEIQQAVGKRT